MIKVVSFNIRCCDDPNGNSVEERALRLEKIMAEYDADIIGFQEFTPIWEKHIDRIFKPDYEMFNIYRSTNELESAPILWKKDKFKLEKINYFWLSDTPDVESKGWDELYDCYRMCIHAKLIEKSTSKEINILNTHFGFGDSGQIKSVKLICDFCEQISNEPICIIGDFNMELDSNGYMEMVKHFSDVNTFTINDFGKTYHGYNPESSDGEHIDYCFANKFITPKDMRIIDESIDGKYPSDHFGLCVSIVI